jgi:hypothetical protein
MDRRPGDYAMPLHDWTRVPAGLFHHFHQSWSIRIVDTLNAGLLPPGAIALVEQRTTPREPDVLAVQTRSPAPSWEISTGGGVLLQEPPVTMFMHRSDRAVYAWKANRIVIRHHLGQIIAVIEIMSPGNKDSRGAIRRFLEKTVAFLDENIHVLVIDVFPPTPRDPLGIHKLIWDEFNENAPFAFPAGKDRVVASYERGYDWAAYVQTLGVGDPLPNAPLFLTRELNPNFYVMIPLESTYQSTWDALPREVRAAVETGEMPDAGIDSEET